MKLFAQLWSDETGFVISSELILIATLLVIGLIAGLSTIRDQVIGELADIADAFSSINNSYQFSGLSGHSGGTPGSQFEDLPDFCDEANAPNAFAHCIAVVAPAAEGAGT
jgi:Flp pilus assembly pilin Flp